MTTEQVQNSLRVAFVGQRITEFDIQGIGFPFLKCHCLGLWVWGAWRIAQSGEIVAGSAARPNIDPSTVSFLIGQTIRSVKVFGPYNDLRLEFSNDAVLETFADLCPGDQWYAVLADGHMLISGPGLDVREE